MLKCSYKFKMKANTYLWSHLPVCYGLDGGKWSDLHIVYFIIWPFLQCWNFAVTLRQNHTYSCVREHHSKCILFLHFPPSDHSQGSAYTILYLRVIFMYFFFSFLFFCGHCPPLQSKDTDGVILPQSKKPFHNGLFRVKERASITEGGKGGRGVA